MHRKPSDRRGFDKLLMDAEVEASAKAMKALQPQFGIFEFGLEFLAYVHIVLSSKKNVFGPAHPSVRAPWALTGAAVSFGLSIRRLCLSGFDTPARALLRTYVETLFLCIAVLHDPALGSAYAAAQTDEEVKNFWYKAASPKKLHERIMAIERKIGLNAEEIDEMAAWRRQEYEILSQSSHLSFLAGAQTALTPNIDEEDSYSTGIFGRASSNSLRTIDYAATTTWYFSRMTNPVLIGEKHGDCALVLEKESEWQQRYVAARDTLSDITLKDWGR